MPNEQAAYQTDPAARLAARINVEVALPYIPDFGRY